MKLGLNYGVSQGGERGVKILEDITDITSFEIECIFQGSDDLLDILLLNDAIKEANPKSRIILCIPYFPYARQDRVMVDGESLSLRVVVQMLRSCAFECIIVADPHSDVLAGMFDPGELEIMDQVAMCYTDLVEAGINNSNTFLVSPDAGALKKIYKAAKVFKVPVIEARKVRDLGTGEIIRTSVEIIAAVGTNPTFIILDDICDGGKTFIELSKEIRKVYGNCVVKLVITHGIFSKGLEVLYEELDEVYSVFNLMKEI